LFQRDTLSELAAAIDDEQGTDVPRAGIVALRATGTRQPLFVVSAQNRNSDFLPYRQLTDRLGPDQPIYGLEAPGLDGRTLPLGSVEQLAAHYVRLIRAFRPEGPHLLLGLTFAGTVAYEVGRQLELEGARPAMVAMLSAGPYVRRKSRTTLTAEPERAKKWFRQRSRNLHHKSGLAFYEWLERHGRRPARWSPWDLQRVANSRAKQRYKAPASGVPIDWFGGRSPLEAEYAELWRPVVGERLRFHPVVGTERERWKHVFLTRPHVDAIADTLAAVMEQRLAEWERP
jgi:thioesterase domain-containing protein